MDSGVVGHVMAEEEDGQTSWTVEDDLVGSENGDSSNSSTCEKYGRTMLSEQDEAFLLSGLEEIEGLFQQKEEDETMRAPPLRRGKQSRARRQPC